MMGVYVKYAVVWIVFMGIIAVITLLVPKLANRAEKAIAKYKRPQEEETEKSEEEK